MTGTASGILLHRAVENGDISEMERLLSLNATEVDFKDSEGYTPLFKALRMKRIDLADILFQHGADVNAEDNSGKSILYNIVVLECEEN